MVVHIIMSGLVVVWRVEGMDEFEMKTPGCLTSSVVKKVAYLVTMGEFCVGECRMMYSYLSKLILVVVFFRSRSFDP